MPEADGDEMVCHLQKEKAEFGDIFKKVGTFSMEQNFYMLNTLSLCFYSD